MTLIGAGGIVLAAFLPWITASGAGLSISVSGMDAGGLFTLAAAGVIATGVLLDWDRFIPAFSMMVGFGIMALGTMLIVNPIMLTNLGLGEGPAAEAGREVVKQLAEPGLGTYMTAFSGLVVCLSSGIGLTR